MPRNEIDSSYFSADILEFIRLLHSHQVRYLIVGGEAVIFYGHTRLTGDIDFFYDREPQNAAALFDALQVFWTGKIPGIQTAEELQENGVVIQFGRPPNRIDLLTRIDGVGFGEAWNARVMVAIQTPEGEVPLFYIGLAELIRNKEVTGRPRDQEDLRFLRKVQP